MIEQGGFSRYFFPFAMSINGIEPTNTTNTRKLSKRQAMFNSKNFKSTFHKHYVLTRKQKKQEEIFYVVC